MGKEQTHHNVKILVLATSFPRWKNDVTLPFAYELGRVLVSKGFEVAVLAPHHQGAKLRENVDGLKVYRFPYFFPKKYQRLAYGGGILPNLRRSSLAKIQAPLLFLSELIYALRLTRSGEIDLIHSNWIIPSGLIGAICRKVTQTKHVMTLHAAGVLALEKLPYKQKMSDFIVRNSDKITAVSTYIGERLIGLVSADLKDEAAIKIEIIPPGVHTELFQNKIDKQDLKLKYGIKSKFSLLFIGRLVDKKGISYLLEAMPQILSYNRDVRLIICGDGPLRKELENLTRQLDLEEFVTFAGYITSQKKIDYLSLSDIVILPSIVTEAGDTEGLPAVILEGLAAGKAIIASDVGGVKDAIKDEWNGFLVEPNNSSQIAERTLQILKNGDLREKFSKNAMETGERYDWKTIGKEYAKIMNAVLEK